MVAVIGAPLPIIFIVVLALLYMCFGRTTIEVVQPDLTTTVSDDAQFEEAPDRETHLAADHICRAVV
jgi:hypothetical protein